MSALQEVVQQLENILKTSNEYGPFVCLDAPAPISILPLDANSKSIQKNTEPSSDLLQRESNRLISQGLGLNQQDDHGVIIGQSFGEDLGGSLHSDTGSNLLGDNGICHDIRGTTHLEKEKNEARVADHMTVTTCNPNDIHSQDVNAASNELLPEDSLRENQEGGEMTVDNPVPSTCAVNNLSTTKRVSSNNPLIHTCNESTVPVVKDGFHAHVDGDIGNEKEDEGEVIVQSLKRKRGRPRKIIDPNSIVPKFKRPRGRPRKYPAPNSNVDHILPIVTEHRSTKNKPAVPTIVSDELNHKNGVGMSVRLEGEKDGTRTTYDIFYVLGLQECDRSIIPTALNQGAPGVQEQQVERVSEGSIVSLIEEVKYNDTGDQPSSIDVPDESFSYHDDVEVICPISESKEAGTLADFHEEQCCQRPTEDLTTDITVHVEKHEQDEEGKEKNGNKVDHPIKRKRGRPKLPVQNMKNLIKRPEKDPKTNISHVGVASSSVEIVGESPLSCASVIQNFHEHSNVQKDVYPTCTQTTNRDTEGKLEYSSGFPIEHSSCKVNNNNNETTEGNTDKCRKKQSGSLSLWEKDTATIQDGTNQVFMEDKVPKLRLRRKTVSETREDQTKTSISISKATDEDDNSIERDATAGNSHSDSPEEVSHPKVPAVHQHEESPSVIQLEVAMANHPPNDQALTEEILPTTVPIDILPLGDSRDQLILLPGHPGNPQKMYNTSRIGKEQSSAKDKSGETVISKDTCEIPQKRGRGRPRKIRPLDENAIRDHRGQFTKKRYRSKTMKIKPTEEEVHDKKTNDASFDIHPPLFPDDKCHEDVHKNFDMLSNVTSLSDSETQGMRNERKSSTTSEKPETVRRVISIVCASETAEERLNNTADILPTKDQALTEEILATLPTNDQGLTKNILSTNDQAMSEEILPTVLTDFLSLGDSSDQHNMLPDHPETSQKVCYTSGIGYKEQTSAKVESGEMVISKDTCETLKKRGRGRPKKIRHKKFRPSDDKVTKDDSGQLTMKKGRSGPSMIRPGEVIHDIEKTNDASMDSHLSLLPEDVDKSLDVGSNAIASLLDSKSEEDRLEKTAEILPTNYQSLATETLPTNDQALTKENLPPYDQAVTEDIFTTNDHSLTKEILNNDQSMTEEILPTNDQSQTKENLLTNDQTVTKKILSTNDQAMTKEILPITIPTDVLRLGELRDQLNLFPDHSENPQKMCNTSGIGKEQSLAKEESDKMVISKDTCENPKQRGRGRPRKSRPIGEKDDSGQFTKKRGRSKTRKIRPSEEVVHDIRKTNDASFDSHPFFSPGHLFHEDVHKNLDKASNATSLNDLETQGMRNESETSSRMSKKHETVQRVISIGCSSKTKEKRQKKTAEILPTNDQPMTEDILPTIDQAMFEDILPPTVPTDVSLGDSRDQLNLLPGHPENPQKLCDASEIDIQEQTSSEKGNGEMAISKDICETPLKRGRGRPRKIRPIDKVVIKDASGLPTKKRGRGRPRKIRPCEEVVQDIDITNGTSFDSRQSLFPDDDFHEDGQKNLDMGCNATTRLNGSKLLDNVSPNTFNELTHCKLSGRDMEAGSNQERDMMINEKEIALRISKKPETVQRVISIVCSSETEDERPNTAAETLPSNGQALTEDILPIIDQALSEDILETNDQALTEEILPNNDQGLTEVILPTDDPALTEETLPTNDQALTKENLPTAVPIDVLPLGDSKDQLNLLPDPPEKPQKECDTSEMNIQEKSSDESDKMVISKDACETPKKRGRGRPRKIRPIDEQAAKDDSGQPTMKKGGSRPGKVRTSGEVKHGIEKTNDSSLDGHLSLFSEDKDKNLDMGSNSTARLNEYKLLDYDYQRTLNELAHCNFSGKDTQACSDQETEEVRSEMETASRISKTPETVQRVISIVCSSETEVHYSTMFKQRRKQHTSKQNHQRIATDVPTTNSNALLSFKNKHRSVLLQKRCMKKTSVRIKKLSKRLINGSLNLDDPSRFAQLFQRPDKHSQTKTKKGRDV